MAKQWLAELGYHGWKLAKSTGKAAWILSTSLLVLVMPLVIELDREAQMVELENQQLGALTGPQGSQPAAAN